MASNEEKESCDMIVLRLLGRNCRNRCQHGAAQAVRVTDGRQDASVHGTCSPDGENAVIR